MSRWRLDGGWRAPLVLGVDRHRVAWPTGSDADIVHCPHADAARTLASLPQRAIHLVAAPDLAVHWMQEAPHALASLQELQRVAQARCADLFGGTEADWRVTGDWRLDRPFVCAALPETTTRSIEASWAGSRTHLRWHSAWALLCERAAHHFPADGWSALRSPTRLHLWSCRSGHVREMATLSIAPGEALAVTAERAALHLRIAGAAEGRAPTSPALRWLDLCAPDAPVPADLQAVAFLPPGTAPSAHEAAAALQLARQVGT